METRFLFPDGGYIDVRVDPHCPFALYSVCNVLAHQCYFKIPSKVSFCKACEFIEGFLSNFHQSNGI